MAYGLGFSLPSYVRSLSVDLEDQKTHTALVSWSWGRICEAVPVMARTVNHRVLGPVHLHHPQLHEAMVEWKQLALKTGGPLSLISGKLLSDPFLNYLNLSDLINKLL